MLPREHHFGRGEKAAVSAAVAAAVGALSVFWARHHAKSEETIRTPREFRPEILNSDKLNPKRLQQLNDTMALMFFRSAPDRKLIMEELGLTKSEADGSIMYLVEHGLITRKAHSNWYETQAHYVPVECWKDKLPQLFAETPEENGDTPGLAYPFLAESIQRIISRVGLETAASDNS